MIINTWAIIIIIHIEYKNDKYNEYIDDNSIGNVMDNENIAVDVKSLN